MRVSKYRATKAEANFGKPITTQVVGGTHITFELITKMGRHFFMTRWPKGLPGHEDPPNTLRFPHGLIRFGETLERCSERLVNQQLGMHVKDVRIVALDSYADALKHWHLEPTCIVELRGTPRVPREAGEIIRFDIQHIPKMTFWPKSDFLDIISEHLPELLKKR